MAFTYVGLQKKRMYYFETKTMRPELSILIVSPAVILAHNTVSIIFLAALQTLASDRR